VSLFERILAAAGAGDRGRGPGSRRRGRRGAPDDFGQLDERRAALLAALDFGGLSTSLAVAMLEDPFPLARADVARVLASEADPSRVCWSASTRRQRPVGRSYAMLAAGRIGRPALGIALGGLGDGCRWCVRPRPGPACHGGEEAFEPIVKLLQVEREPRCSSRARQPVAARRAAVGGRGGPLCRSGRARPAAGGGRLAGPQPAAAAFSGAAAARRRRRAGDRVTALAGLAGGPLDEADRRAVAAALGDRTGGSARGLPGPGRPARGHLEGSRPASWPRCGRPSRPSSRSAPCALRDRGRRSARMRRCSRSRAVTSRGWRPRRSPPWPAAARPRPRSSPRSGSGTPRPGGGARGRGGAAAAAEPARRSSAGC